MATITAWRIVKAKYKSSAFSGIGAKKGGGRWNSIGISIVYTAGSLSLATLEALAHLPSYKSLKFYKCISITFDSSLVTKPAPPNSWDLTPPGPISMSFGDQWFQEGRFAVLEVPSKIIPGESNFLLNPTHPDFGNMEIGDTLAYPYDSRLHQNK